MATDAMRSLPGASSVTGTRCSQRAMWRAPSRSSIPTWSGSRRSRARMGGPADPRPPGGSARNPASATAGLGAHHRRTGELIELSAGVRALVRYRGVRRGTRRCASTRSPRTSWTSTRSHHALPRSCGYLRAPRGNRLPQRTQPAPRWRRVRRLAHWRCWINPDELAGSLLRVGREHGQLVRHGQALRAQVGAPGRVTHTSSTAQRALLRGRAPSGRLPRCLRVRAQRPLAARARRPRRRASSIDEGHQIRGPVLNVIAGTRSERTM